MWNVLLANQGVNLNEWCRLVDPKKESFEIVVVHFRMVAAKSFG